MPDTNWKEIQKQTEERRKDEDFPRRLDHAMKDSREALDLLAENDEEQPDQQ